MVEWQVVKHLSSKHEALISNPSIEKRKPHPGTVCIAQ
jgi:hypothetical protein